MSFLCLMLALQVAPARPQPADVKAFTEANRTVDAGDRVAALEAFLAQYPGSQLNGQARRALVRATAEKWPQDPGRVRQAIERVTRDLDPEARVPVLAAALETYGEMWVGRDPAEARKAFTQALELNPARAEVALKLADLAERRGSDAEALELLAQARLVSPSARIRQRFEAKYESVRGGSAGRETYLDQRYEKVFPPMSVEPYRGGANRGRRVVLAELFTGAGCGPCAAADLAFDAVLARYTRNEVAVVMYHEHIPRPDPLTNADSVKRASERQVRGVPAWAIDGRMEHGEGGLRDRVAETDALLRARIEPRLEAAPGARLNVRAIRRTGRRIRISVATNAPRTARVRLVLVEKRQRYSGENGIRFHPMVARAIQTLNPQTGEVTFDVDAVEAALLAHLESIEQKNDTHNPDGDFRFLEKKHGIDEKNLAVVAFVEEGATYSVLQAAYRDVP